MIRKLQSYVNNDGIKIEHIEPNSPDDVLQFQYFGVAQMVTSFGQSEVRFVIPANTLNEAFEKYDEELKKFSEEMKKQFAEKAKKAEEAKASEKQSENVVLADG